MKRLIATLPALAAGLLLGCGSTAGTGGTGGQAGTAGGTPSPSASAQVTQNLTLTGDLAAGTMTNATIDCSDIGEVRNGEYINLDFKGQVGGKDTDIDLEIRQPGNGAPGYHGPGDYDVAGLGDGKGHASVTVGDNGVDTDPNSGGGTGKITINPDKKSGSVSVQFNTNNEQLSGDWHCS